MNAEVGYAIIRASLLLCYIVLIGDRGMSVLPEVTPGATRTGTPFRPTSSGHTMTILFYTHSWLRYLVLLAALVALVALGYGILTGRSVRTARKFSTLFVGLLDLQVVLGIMLMMNGVYPDAVAGHLILMIFAVIVTHGAYLVGQQMESERVGLAIRFGGIVAALVLIVVGIMAIGQTILGYSAFH